MFGFVEPSLSKFSYDSGSGVSLRIVTRGSVNFLHEMSMGCSGVAVDSGGGAGS